MACSLILAGTCDVKALKLTRILRKRLQDSGLSHYGFNMALNMAIGFLFLGNGNYSFRRDNVALAGLLISIYPHFPNHTNDNKYHLQALRHFYILAIEQRVFYAVDIQGYDIVNIWVEMEFLMGNDIIVKEKHQTPVLLQDSKKLIGIEVIDEEYYKVSIKEDNINKAVFVKRKYINKKSIENNENKGIFLNSQKELDILTNVIKTMESDNKELRNDAHTIDFLLSSKGYCDKSKGLLIKMMHGECNQWFTKRKIIDLESVYSYFIKEDRVEFFEAYFLLNRNYMDFSQITSGFISNFQIICEFYCISRTLLKTNEISQLFNSSSLLKIHSNLSNLFNFNELLKNQC